MIKDYPYLVELTARFEVEVSAQNAPEAEAKARDLVKASWRDLPLLGPTTWSIQANAQGDLWGV